MRTSDVLGLIENIMNNFDYEECCDIAKYGLNKQQEQIIAKILVDKNRMGEYTDILEKVKKHCEHEYYGE